MPRLSVALKRAAAQTNGAEQTPGRPSDGAAATPFVSAWDLDPAREETVLAGESAVEDGPGRLTPGLTGEDQAAGTAGSGSAAPSIRLDSQLAMSWPAPFAAEVSAKLVVMRETDAAAIAQYDRLKAAMLRAQLERSVKVVMVSSAVAGEGRTLTATNLALMLSGANGGRVLLVDSDLRQPRTHELFQVSSVPGLGGCLKSTTALRLPFVEVTGSLTLLPAGRPQADPGEVLGSDRMRAVLAEARAAFDWVILDTAPVVLQSDAGLLAPLVEGAVLVIEAGKTPLKLIERAVDVLGRDRLLGVVLNRASDAAVAAAAGA